MTDLKKQKVNLNDPLDAPIDKMATINYIYQMVITLKSMSSTVNEPLIPFLLELVENESRQALKRHKMKTNYYDGANEIRPPE